MQMIAHFLCSDMNHSLTIATSEEQRKLNAVGVQLAELEAGPVRNI